MRRSIAFSLFASILICIGCGDGNVVLPIDPAIQREADSLIITEYFDENGFPVNEQTLTSSGVRHVILEQGTGELIDESDIVRFNYIGFVLNDTIFDTSINEVADSIRLAVEESLVSQEDTSDIEEFLLAKYADNITLEPLEVTYTASGWTFRDEFIPGFVDGVAASFNGIRIGGKSLIVIPSELAYGQQGRAPFIAPDEVIAFELYPIEITKQ